MQYVRIIHLIVLRHLYFRNNRGKTHEAGFVLHPSIYPAETCDDGTPAGGRNGTKSGTHRGTSYVIGRFPNVSVRGKKAKYSFFIG